MRKRDKALKRLVKLSRSLGKEEKKYVILGEGNVSAKIDENSFWIKASGAQLKNIREKDFVEVKTSMIIEILKFDDLSDQEIKKELIATKINKSSDAIPSVETMMHAVLLNLEGVNFVAHTHPVSVNKILCSKNAESAFSGRLFPDEIVICGLHPLFIRYIDPGLKLAKLIKEEVTKYKYKYKKNPAFILLKNHGIITLGSSVKEVENIISMCVKVSEILIGTYVMGGPNFLTKEDSERIATRQDEKYRKKIISNFEN